MHMKDLTLTYLESSNMVIIEDYLNVITYSLDDILTIRFDKPTKFYTIILTKDVVMTINDEDCGKILHDLWIKNNSCVVDDENLEPPVQLYKYTEQKED